MRVHGTTQRRPLEVFTEEEQPRLLPAPVTAYEVPLYAEPLVHRDYHIQVGRGLYSIPERYLGTKLWVRADSKLVKAYYGGQLIKVHPRVRPGGRSTDPNDLPAGKRAYAMRDIDYLKRTAAGHGASIGVYAERLLDSPLPWTKMRQVYALLGLVRRYGAERTEQACKRALEQEAISARLIQRMLERSLEDQQSRLMPQPDNVVQLRFARSADEFRIDKGGL